MKKMILIMISIAATALLACNPLQNGTSNVIVNGRVTSEESDITNPNSGVDNNSELVENSTDNSDDKVVDSEETNKEFTFTSAEEIENISDEDLTYILNHDYKTYDFFPEGEYTKVDLFGVELQVPTEDCPEATEEYITVVVLSKGSEDLNTLKDSQQIKTYAGVKLMDSIYSHQTMFSGDRTGTAVKDAEALYCGETDTYVEYSARFTESRSYYDNRELVTTEIPRAYRYVYMKSIVKSVTGDSTQLVMLGELSKEYVEEQLDIYLSSTHDLTLYREVTEDEGHYFYTRYYACMVYGDYGVNDCAYLYKETLIVDKDTQVVHYEPMEEVKMVSIP